SRPLSTGGIRLVGHKLDGQYFQGAELFVVKLPSTPCQPTAAALTPPPPPPGYRYSGREVVVDFVLDPRLTTLPGDRGPAATDRIFLYSETVVRDGVVCDVIVAHYYEPQNNDQRCLVPPGMLAPPPAPPGFRYVGFDVVVNFVLVDSTVPLEREERPTDVNFVTSQTTVGNFNAQCDIVVRHLFEPIP
ncbi:MAG: hypothetical protein AB1758_29310, partial [Candidatus Eremiobacterota bacterium]